MHRGVPYEICEIVTPENWLIKTGASSQAAIFNGITPDYIPGAAQGLHRWNIRPAPLSGYAARLL